MKIRFFTVQYLTSLADLGSTIRNPFVDRVLCDTYLRTWHFNSDHRGYGCFCKGIWKVSSMRVLSWTVPMACDLSKKYQWKDLLCIMACVSWIMLSHPQINLFQVFGGQYTSVYFRYPGSWVTKPPCICNLANGQRALFYVETLFFENNRRGTRS